MAQTSPSNSPKENAKTTYLPSKKYSKKRPVLTTPDGHDRSQNRGHPHPHAPRGTQRPEDNHPVHAQASHICPPT
eukprot:1384628-Ditylum_brightwellii.AAC.1